MLLKFAIAFLISASVFAEPVVPEATATALKAKIPTPNAEPLALKKQSLSDRLEVDSAMLDEMSEEDIDFSEGDENLTDADFIDLQ